MRSRALLTGNTRIGLSERRRDPMVMPAATFGVESGGVLLNTLRMVAPNKSEIRQLKARAQRLKPILQIGKQGVTTEFLAALDAALSRHELVKVKFAAFKDQKKTLAPQVAEQTGSCLVALVGNVMALYGPRPTETDPTAEC